MLLIVTRVWWNNVETLEFGINVILMLEYFENVWIF